VYKRQAYDINKDLILLFKALKKHEIPLNLKMLSKKEYLELKNSKTHSPLRAIAGILYSFSGGWFNSYCPTSGFPDNRNYVQEGYRSLNSMIPIIKQIKFDSKDYRKLVPKNCIIYCDPPYKNTCQKYAESGSEFDTEEFWDIMRSWSIHNIVFVSELHAPSDFKCIWKKSYSSSVNYHGTSDRVEKLFVIGRI
jgi:site-specific DNA-adenine methylase